MSSEYQLSLSSETSIWLNKCKCKPFKVTKTRSERMSWMATSPQPEKFARASASNVAVLVTLPSSSSRWLTRRMATRVLSMRRPCFRSLQSQQIWPQMPPTIFSSSWLTSLSPWSATHGGIIGLRLFPAVTLVRRSYMIRRSLRIQSS